jgi:hypothetical protein
LRWTKDCGDQVESCHPQRWERNERECLVIVSAKLCDWTTKDRIHCCLLASICPWKSEMSQSSVATRHQLSNRQREMKEFCLLYVVLSTCTWCLPVVRSQPMLVFVVFLSTVGDDEIQKPALVENVIATWWKHHLNSLLLTIFDHHRHEQNRFHHFATALMHILFLAITWWMSADISARSSSRTVLSHQKRCLQWTNTVCGQFQSYRHYRPNCNPRFYHIFADSSLSMARSVSGFNDLCSIIHSTIRLDLVRWISNSRRPHVHRNIAIRYFPDLRVFLLEFASLDQLKFEGWSFCEAMAAHHLGISIHRRERSILGDLLVLERRALMERLGRQFSDPMWRLWIIGKISKPGIRCHQKRYRNNDPCLDFGWGTRLCCAVTSSELICDIPSIEHVK